MPPSGFSQKAINGLLEFVRVNYQLMIEEYNLKSSEFDSEQDFLKSTSDKLRLQVESMLRKSFPHSEKLETGIKGLVLFITECYLDLAGEIEKGTDKHNQQVVDGHAIQKELDQIGAFLKDFTI